MTAGGDREEVLDRHERHVGRTAARLARDGGLGIEARSAGTRVWDADGREYLECGGYGVFILGHGHPAVVAAVREQLERHALSSRLLVAAETSRAAERLASVTPAGLDKVWFGSTGAEATEAAIKLARANRRPRLVAMERGFHGKTMGALSITGRLAFQRPFAPLLPDVTTIPYGDLAALDEALAVEGERTCVVLEPVQAEGGVVVPPPGWLRGVAERCRAAGALLVADEIQTGLGRLGRWWGVDGDGVVPDLLLVGKALGGGVLPVSALVARPEVFEPFDRNPRLHTSTFSGAPVLMAAATAAIDALEAEDAPARAAVLGERLLERARAAAGDGPATVRGAGLLIGIELPHPRQAGALLSGLLREGVIATGSLAADTVVRLTPPALLDAEDEAWLGRALDRALAGVADAAAPA